MDLKAYRQTAGMTQLRLAQRSGLPLAKISLVENGYVRLTREETILIQEAVRAYLRERATKIYDTLKLLEA